MPNALARQINNCTKHLIRSIWLRWEWIIIGRHSFQCNTWVSSELTKALQNFYHTKDAHSSKSASVPMKFVPNRVRHLDTLAALMRRPSVSCIFKKYFSDNFALFPSFLIISCKVYFPNLFRSFWLLVGVIFKFSCGLLCRGIPLPVCSSRRHSSLWSSVSRERRSHSFDLLWLFWRRTIFLFVSSPFASLPAVNFCS